jgi:hypothetical protein
MRYYPKTRIGQVIAAGIICGLLLFGGLRYFSHSQKPTPPKTVAVEKKESKNPTLVKPEVVEKKPATSIEDTMKGFIVEVPTPSKHIWIPAVFILLAVFILCMSLKAIGMFDDNKDMTTVTTTTDDRKASNFLEKAWLNERWQLPIVFAFIHMAMWWIWWTWTKQNWLLLLFTYVALAIAFWVRVRDPKSKPPQHFLGGVLLFFLLLLVLNETGLVRMGEKWPVGSGVFPPSWSVWASSNTPSSSTSGQNVYARGTATLTPPTERFDEECKARAAKLNKEMREKIKVDFKDHPWMIPVACRESGFNQTKPGTTEVLKGEQDSNDRGVFQINLTHHAAKIKELGLDVDIYEGNATYTKYLLSTPQGIDHWFPKESGRWYAPMDIAIPITKDWSPYIQIPELTKKIQYLIRNKKPFMAEMDGTEVVMDPTLEKSYGAAKKIRFKSIDGNDSVMDIPIEFHPVP